MKKYPYCPHFCLIYAVKKLKEWPDWKRCQLVSKLKVNSLKYADAAILLVKRQLMETKSKIKKVMLNIKTKLM